jgi:hypothetical protein
MTHGAGLWSDTMPLDGVRPESPGSEVLRRTLTDVLMRLCAGETDLESLLPDRWAASHREHVLQHRLDESRWKAARQKAVRATASAGPEEGVRITEPEDGAR